MQSLKFPNIFNTNSTNTFKPSQYKEATMQNVMLLLKSDRSSLFGDPYFGSMISQYLFEPNTYMMTEMLKDTIYTQLAIFIPQIKLERKDITIVKDKQKGKIYCYFHAINQIDYTTDTFELVLFDNSKFD